MTSEYVKNLIQKAYEEKAEFLDLGNCGLTEIPEEIIVLAPFLKELNLGHTKNVQLREKPIKNDFSKNENSLILLEQLVELERLFLEHTNLKKEHLENFLLPQKLSELRLTSNNITDLSPNAIENLRLLKVLWLDFNRLTDATLLELTKLKSITHLYISGNEITDVGVEHIERLQNIDTLFLSYCKISEIGIKNIVKLKNLRALFISGNDIGDLGAKELREHKNIIFLDVSGNKLTDVGAKAISELNQLFSLYINENSLTDAGAEAITKLNNLRHLDIGSNQISDMGAATFTALNNLNYLNICNNQLTDFSAKVLIKLRFIETLILSNNKIESLQPFLPLFTRVKLPLQIVAVETNETATGQINVKGNPLSNPPMEVVQQGNATVLRYFEKLAKEGQRQVFEAKLVLTGSGEVGKTSLSRRLNNRYAPLPDRDDRTRDVEVSDYEFTMRNGKPFTAHIWDFGGQQIIHNFHRLFMNQSALYILLTETSRENDDIDYWLQTIRLFGGESPILFVQNQRKGMPRRLDISHYKPHFNIKNDLYEVNLFTNEGLDDLDAAIRQLMPRLPVVQRTVPKSWYRLREQLHNVKEAVISYDRFVDLCGACGITERVDIEDAGGFLHLLGILLWYKDNPALREKIILEREWATRALFMLIFNEAINRQKGYFTLTDAQRVWDGEAAYRHHTRQLVALMLEFKLAYRQRHKTDAYIIPALLPAQAPAKGFGAVGRLTVSWHYTHLPRGMVNQLTAELYRLIEDDLNTWSEGVWLKHENTEARVTENKVAKTITVEVAGAQNRELFGAIKHTLEEIHAEYRGIEFIMKIPCICAGCKKGPAVHYFDYARVRKWQEERKKPTIECGETGEDVPLRELLDNITPPLHHNEITMPKKIFLSYSHADETYKKELDTHFAALRRSGKVDTWQDRKLVAGDNWNDEIIQALHDSDIVLLLLSPDFMASDYIWNVELKKAFDAGKKIIPIFLRPCDFKETVFGIHQLQGLPRDAKWITSRWPQRDEAYLEVVQGVKALL